MTVYDWRMQQRGATEAEILSSGDVPLERELVVAKDTGSFWIGDGVNPPSNLPKQGPVISATNGTVALPTGESVPTVDPVTLQFPTAIVNAMRGALLASADVLRLEDFFAPDRVEGQTDDTDALQAAVNAAAGRTLALGGNRIRVTRTVEISADDTSIDAHGATLDLIDDGTMSGVRVYVHDCSRFSWTAGTLSQAATARTGVYGLLHLKSVTDAVIDVVRCLGGSSTGIFIEGGSFYALRNVVVRDCLADGIHVSRGAHDVVIASPVISGTGDDAIGVVAVVQEPVDHSVTYPPVTRVFISDVLISDVNVAGGGVSFVGCTDSALRGGSISDIGSGGVKISGDVAAGALNNASNISVSDVIVRGCGQGFAVGDATDCELANVQAIDNKDAGVIIVNAVRLLVSGGRFRGNASFGIYEGAGTGNHVIGADLRGNAASAAQVASAVLTNCVTA